MNRILVYGMTDNPGGIETYVMNEFYMLDSSKAVFDFVCDFPSMVYKDEVEKRGSRVYFIPAKGKGLLKHWAAFEKLLKAHPEYKYIYFNVMDAGQVLTMLVPKRLKRKIIIHSHNSNTDKPQLHKMFKPLVNKIADKRYACSLAAARHMFGNAPAKIIPNAIDLRRYVFDADARKNKRAELEINDDEYVIIHVGRLSYQKNVKRLLDIYGEVLKEGKKVRLLQVGDGEQKEEIYSYAKENGIYDKVDFLGKRGDVPELMMAADVLLLPSLYEGLTLVGIEAQATGLPCVFSDGVDADTKINRNVIFIPLSKDNKKWVEAVMSFKGSKRNIDQSLITVSGYDLKHPGSAQRELTQFLEGETIK